MDFQVLSARLTTHPVDPTEYEAVGPAPRVLDKVGVYPPSVGNSDTLMTYSTSFGHGKRENMCSHKQTVTVKGMRAWCSSSAR